MNRNELKQLAKFSLETNNKEQACALNDGIVGEREGLMALSNGGETTWNVFHPACAELLVRAGLL